jgi:hypothetical protein
MEVNVIGIVAIARQVDPTRDNVVLTRGAAAKCCLIPRNLHNDPLGRGVGLL